MSTILELPLSHIINMEVGSDPYSCSAFVVGNINNLQSYMNGKGRITFRLSNEFDFLKSYPKAGVYSAIIVDDGKLELEDLLRPLYDKGIIEWSHLIGNVYVSQIFEVKFTEFSKPSYLVPSDPGVIVSQFTANCDISFYKLVCNQTMGNRLMSKPNHIFVNCMENQPKSGVYQVQLTRSQKVSYTLDSVNLLAYISE